MFLDEPTTGLDPQARHHFWQRIEAIKAQGKTVVLTTHYMDEAQQLCDRIAIVDHGHLLSLDTPAALLARHFDGVLVRLADHPALASLGYPLLPHGEQVELSCPDVAALLPRLLSPLAPAQEVGHVFSDSLPQGKQGPQLVVVPAGRYLLGDHGGRGNHNERPLTPIEISQPFAIGRYEVTFNDWQQYAEATATPMPDNEGWGLSAQRPVIHVSC